MEKIVVCVFIALSGISLGKSASVDSLIITFIQKFEQQVVYDTQYVHPQDSSLWSTTHRTCKEFSEIPDYYGESYREGEYLFEKTRWGDTTNLQILAYDQTIYRFIQCNFLLADDGVVGASMILCPKNDLSHYVYMYDPYHMKSDRTVWSQQSTKKKKGDIETIPGPEQIITMEELENKVRTLLE